MKKNLEVICREQLSWLVSRSDCLAVEYSDAGFNGAQSVRLAFPSFTIIVSFERTSLDYVLIPREDPDIFVLLLPLLNRLGADIPRSKHREDVTGQIAGFSESLRQHYPQIEILFSSGAVEITKAKYAGVWVNKVKPIRREPHTSR